MKINHSVLFLFVLAVFWGSGYAQKSAAKPVQAESWEEFTAADKSFKVLLPKQTEKDKQDSQLLRGLTKFKDKDLFVYTGGVSYGVIFNDLPAAPVDEMERDARYELQLAKIGRKTKNVSAQKHLGVEGITEINQGGNTYDFLFRLLLVQQRVFSVSITVPSLKKLSIAQRKFYQAKIDNFFNSFTVLNIPPAKYEPVPLLPKDFKITSNGQLFKSEALNLSIHFPADWITEIHDPNKKPDPESEKERIWLRWHQRNGVGVLGAGRPAKNASVGININRRQFADITLKEFVDEMAEFIGSDLFSKTKTPLPVKPVTINGREFLTFEKTEEDGIKKVYYFADLDKWVLEIWVRYAEESDKKKAEDALNTLKF